MSTFLSAAEKHHYDIREWTATAAQRNEEWKSAVGRLLPALSLSGTYTRNSFEDVTISVPDPKTGTLSERKLLLQNQLSGVLSISAPLVDVAGIQRARAAKVVQQAAELRVSAVVVEVKKNVAKVYYQYVAAAALHKAATQSVQTAKDNGKLVDAKIIAGTASQLELERSKADVERSKQVEADAELTQLLAERALETLTGLRPDGQIEPVEDDLHEEFPMDTWKARVESTPSVQAAKMDVKAAALQASASYFALSPTLSAVFNEQLNNASGFSGQTSTWYFGLSLGWRFDVSSIFSAKASTAAKAIAEIREERARRDMDDQVVNAFRQLKTYIVRSRAARAQLAAASKMVELAQARYKAGVSTQLEVSQAERDRLSAEANKIQADADVAYSRVLLRLLTDEEIR